MTGLAQTLYLFVFTHPLPVFLVLAALAAVLLHLPVLRRAPPLRLPYRELAIGGSLILVLTLVAAAIDLSAPGFLNPTSGGLANTAAYFDHGAPLYTAPGDPRVYSYIYGPVMFYAHLPALWLFDGVGLVIAVKLVFALLFAAGFLVFARHLLRETDTSLGLVLLLLYVVLLARYGETAYSNRGDCILLALVSFAAPLVRAGRRPALSDALVMGLLAGLAAGTKLHAPIYFLPFILRGMYAGGWRWTLAGAAGGLVALALPFLDPRIAPASYLHWLALSFAQGIDTATLAHAAETGLIYMLAPAALLLAAWRRLAPETRLLLGGCIVTLALVTGPAGKIGAGAHHFIPLLPVLVLALGRALREAGPALSTTLAHRPAAGALAGWLAVLLLLGLGPTVAVAARMAAHYGDPAPRAVARAAERFAGHNWQIGFGERFALSDSYAVVASDAGQPIFVDYHAAADRLAGGRPVGRATVAALADCPHEIWLIPRGQRPFAGGSVMTGGHPALGPVFRSTFEKHYRREETGPVFDVWICYDDGHE
jgi:hypothetical protein